MLPGSHVARNNPFICYIALTVELSYKEYRKRICAINLNANPINPIIVNRMVVFRLLDIPLINQIDLSENGKTGKYAWKINTILL